LDFFREDHTVSDRPWSVEGNGAHRKPLFCREDDPMTEKPTQEQLAELKKLSKEARVEDWSEIVTSKEEAAKRIEDLKIKARIE
jgi:hypothetical protein